MRPRSSPCTSRTPVIMTVMSCCLPVTAPVNTRFMAARACRRCARRVLLDAEGGMGVIRVLRVGGGFPRTDTKITACLPTQPWPTHGCTHGQPRRPAQSFSAPGHRKQHPHCWNRVAGLWATFPSIRYSRPLEAPPRAFLAWAGSYIPIASITLSGTRSSAQSGFSLSALLVAAFTFSLWMASATLSFSRRA